jgi:hypothetical protein
VDNAASLKIEFLKERKERKKERNIANEWLSSHKTVERPCLAISGKSPSMLLNN